MSDTEASQWQSIVNRPSCIVSFLLENNFYFVKVIINEDFHQLEISLNT